MQLNRKIFLAVAGAIAFSAGGSVLAVNATYFGSTTPGFVNPAWSPSLLTTSEQWDTFTSSTGAAVITPSGLAGVNNFLDQPGGGLAVPTVTVTTGANSNIYMPVPRATYTTNNVFITIPNYGGPTGALLTGGTYVNVQVAGTTGANGDGGVYPITTLDYAILSGSLHLTDIADVTLTGGASGDGTMTMSHFNSGSSFLGPSFTNPYGDSNTHGETYLYKFFIPNYTGDFKVAWTEQFHSIFDAVRVDTLTVLPEPASLGMIGIGLTGLLARRRRAVL